MKKINIILSGFVLGLLCGCTDLDEHVYSNISIDNFFKNENELIANAGRAYTKLQGYSAEQSLWTLLLQASDECAVPACPGWYSNGRYEEIQTNKIPASNKLLTKGWNWIFNGIASCNEIIYETELSSIEFEGKDKIVAEMKVLRAFYYYQAIACWGNVPFTVDYTDTGYPKQESRQEVFNFLVKEINDNIDKLDVQPSTSNYGRITQAAANCILAKMYLNAEVWFGTPMYDKAEAICKKIIDTGAYSLEDDYSANFNASNENSKENIFVIPYDHVYTSGETNAFYLYILTLEAGSQATFNIPAEPWSGFICQPDFFQTYADNDLRRSQSWLYGEQYDLSGNDLKFAYTSVFDEKKYYNSNGGRGTYDGARCWKWHYQTDGSLKNYTVSMDNDFVIFRYADVILMYTEALIRQSKESQAVQLDGLKKIRTRAGLPIYKSGELTLNELYAERGRELAWEGWRHEDMIRYGKYLKKYWAHPDQSTQTFRNVFPIPVDILNANPNLVQNDSY